MKHANTGDPRKLSEVGANGEQIWMDVNRTYI